MCKIVRSQKSYMTQHYEPNHMLNFFFSFFFFLYKENHMSNFLGFIYYISYKQLYIIED